VSAEVRFSYDSSGLLEVDVHVPLAGTTRNLVIVDEEDRPDPADIEKRRAALAKLKFHPREEAANAALLARAERCYEDHIGELRQAIGHWITQFAGALDTQDPRRIADARDFLLARLDEFDRASPL
jgi:molecular chaperone HscC